jgi:hypothetical protein
MKRKLFEHVGGNTFKLSEWDNDQKPYLPDKNKPYKTTYYDKNTDAEIPITVKYEFQKGHSSTSLDPGQSDTVNIFSIKDNNGNNVVLSPENKDKLEQEIINHINTPYF